MASSNVRAWKTQPENIYQCLRVKEAQKQISCSIILTVKNEDWEPEEPLDVMTCDRMMTTLCAHWHGEKRRCGVKNWKRSRRELRDAVPEVSLILRRPTSLLVQSFLHLSCNAPLATSDSVIRRLKWCWGQQKFPDNVVDVISDHIRWWLGRLGSGLCQNNYSSQLNTAYLHFTLFRHLDFQGKPIYNAAVHDVSSWPWNRIKLSHDFLQKYDTPAKICTSHLTQVCSRSFKDMFLFIRCTKICCETGKLCTIIYTVS